MTPLTERMEVQVERVAVDRWRVWPQDETWLNLVVHAVMDEDLTAVAAVVKEHPQHEGVLLRGEATSLRRAMEGVQRRLTLLEERGLEALRCPDYRTANALRRAILTRPRCLAAQSVHFTDHVADLEYEPVAAHRIGQLAFRVESSEAVVASEAHLVVPPGELARARHIVLPSGVSLLPGEGEVVLGLRAAPAGGPPSSTGPPCAGPGLLLAVIDLAPGSVLFQKHSKFRTTTAVSYRPEVRIAPPIPEEAAKILTEAGLHLSHDGVVQGQEYAVRSEFVVQLLPTAVLQEPREIVLDFEPLGLPNKEEVLRGTFRRLSSEIEDVLDQLDQDVVVEKRCPDIARVVS